MGSLHPAKEKVTFGQQTRRGWGCERTLFEAIRAYSQSMFAIPDELELLESAITQLLKDCTKRKKG